MAKHRASPSRPRALSGLLAIMLAAVALVAVPTTANAATARLRVVGQNSVDKFNCQFTVSSVDLVNGVVHGTLAGNAFPASLSGYFTIANNQVYCQLNDGSGNTYLAAVYGSANNPKVSVSSPITVPYLASYQLCGQAAATTKSGTTTNTAYVCQTG